MGKVEKIVVLGVLFLIAVILTVSLDLGGSGGETSSGESLAAASEEGVLAAERDLEAPPLDVPGAGEDVGGEERGGAPAQDPDPLTGDPDVLLNGAVGGVVDPRARESVPPVAPMEAPFTVASAIPGAGDLVTLERLTDALSPEFKVYTCLEGDTFKKVAARYYGDAAAAGLLRRYNEGLQTLEDGQELLIPILRDDSAGAGDYEVLEGESLWRIAKKLYGEGHRWTEIWEANKGLLKSPDRVKVGMVLVIP